MRQLLTSLALYLTLFLYAGDYALATPAYCGKDKTACSTGSDKDWDGHSADDCDDTNWQIYYPSESLISLPLYTTSGCTGGQYHQCQSNGTYSACVGTVLAESATHNYVIDPAGGSDANACTRAAPCKTFANLTDYTSGGASTAKPGTWIGLACGDYVYIKAGTISTGIVTWNGSGSATGFLQLHNKGCSISTPIVIKADPGAAVTVQGGGNDAGLYTDGTTYGVLENITFDGAPIYIDAGSDSWELRGNTFKNTNFDAANNTAGVKLNGVNHSRVHHNTLFDNYDHRTASCGAGCGGAGSGDCTCNENNSNIVGFQGTDNKIENNLSYYSQASHGTCYKWKHGACNSDGTKCTANLSIKNNVAYTCNVAAVRSSQPNTTVANNYIADSVSGYKADDAGGTSEQQGTVIQNNTFLNTPALQYTPQQKYNLTLAGVTPTGAADACSGTATIGTLVFSNNIVSLTGSGALYDISSGFTNTGDPLYNIVTTGNNLVFSNNCVYNNGAAVSVPFYTQNNGNTTCSGTGNNGTTYATWAAWLAAGFETNSNNIDPVLGADGIATAASCSTLGYRSGVAIYVGPTTNPRRGHGGRD